MRGAWTYVDADVAVQRPLLHALPSSASPEKFLVSGAVVVSW